MANSREHITCALCGLMITMERYGRGPFPPITRTQTWGGSAKREKGDRWRRQGIMDWSEPRSPTREDLQIIRGKLLEALKEVEKEIG